LRFRKCEIPYDIEAIHKSTSKKYKKAFVLDGLPVVKDNVRIESDKQAAEITRFIEKSYSELDIEIVKVPIMSRIERVEFILKNL
jgi:predicted ATPase